MKDLVLLVDDKQSNLIVLEEVLSKLDLECIKTKTSNEVYTALQNNDISLILCDVQLPGVDGFDILIKIRENKEWENIPIIMISAVYKTDEFQIRGIKLGALDFIVKPIIPELLIAKIQTFLELYKYRKQQDHKLQDLSSKLQMTEIIKNENLILIAANVIFQNINKYNTENETYKFILNILIRITNGSMGLLCNKNEEGELELQAFLEVNADDETNQVLDKEIICNDLISREIWKRAIDEKKSVIDNNPPPGTLNLTSIMAVPLMTDNKVYGIIGLTNNSDGFNTKDVENIDILSSIVTEATSRKKVEIELEKYKNSLEKMVEERTHQLEINNKKLNLEKKERKAAEDIINSSPIVAFRWKSLHEGKIDYVSSNVEEISGYTVDELVTGKVSIKEIVHSDDIQDVYIELIGFIKDGTKNNYSHKPFRIIKKNGEIIWVDERIFFERNNDGYVTEFKGIILNITDKIAAEDELIIAKERAEESDRLKTSFLANMSHEIRTPMNAILGFSQLLSLPGVEEEDLRGYVDTITTAGMQLMRLIDDIISISRIEAGIIEIVNENVDVEKILKGVQKLFKIDADKKKLIFSYTNKVPKYNSYVTTDPRRLQQVLINLISNAFKFTSHGSIEYGCSLVDGFIEFYVRDTGIGIKKEDETIIFERFMKVDHGKDVLYGGTGIGLSISNAIVETLGGKIWVNSEYNNGAEFKFTIPILIRHKKEKEVNIEDFSFPDYSNKTILIAEDEPYNYQLIKILLSHTGANVIWANDGQETIDLLNMYSNIDLILMDIKMPVKDGIEATKEIRKKNKKIPIIAQTAYAQTGDRQKTMAAGCNNYISKPIEQKKLFEIISKYLIN